MAVLAETVARVRSGVFHVVCLDAADKRISSGSAFMAKNCLVTNGHVFDVPTQTCRVWLRQDGHTGPTQGVCLSSSVFRSRRIVASPKEEYDYAAMEIPELKQFNPYQFNIVDPGRRKIGEQVAFLGYPLEHQNLTCHQGIISSFYHSAPADIIQVNASVNPSNSGGPLFDQTTGEVIGIITRKATGLTGLFGELRKVVSANIAALATIRGEVRLQGISFKEVLRAGQSQMLIALDEIERSANVGIGYAFSCKHLLEERDFSSRI